MLTFLGKRLFSSVMLVVVVMAMTFTFVFSRGERIARQLLGDYATEEQVSARAEELGLNEPVLTQYIAWMFRALQGDLGTSWFTSEPVAGAIISRLDVTFTLMVVVTLLTAVLAVILGLVAAVYRGWVDRLIQSTALLGLATPNFIVALFLVLFFGLQLGMFPATGWTPFGTSPLDWAIGLILPVTALLIGSVAATAQQVRSALISELQKDYIRTLRSRGLGSTEIMLRHALRAASPPGLTILGLQFIGLLSGAVFIEQIFALPGLGYMAVEATNRGDLPLVLGIVLFTVLMVVVVNLAVDLMIGWLNPKVRIT